MADPSPLLKPRPRRTFELAPTPTESSDPPSPSPHDFQTSSHSDLKHTRNKSPGRTRSILNLTSSTLLGIYSPIENGPTPYGNGSQTPNNRNSVDDSRPPVIGAFEKYGQRRPQHRHHHHQRSRSLLEAAVPTFSRTLVLFIIGVAYGVVIIHLHDNRRIVPVQVEGIERYSWRYLLLWGAAGVFLGQLLPWVDWLWDETIGRRKEDDNSHPVDPDKDDGGSHDDPMEEEHSVQASSVTGTADWLSVVRSIGAFVGIAFAIVRVPASIKLSRSGS